MRWRFTVNHSGKGTRSHHYSWPAEAWKAYDAAITALEADGFVRRGMESVRSAQAPRSDSSADATHVTVQLDRTDAAPTAADQVGDPA